MITNICHCPKCGSNNLVKNGHTVYGAQRGLCADCGKTSVIERKISNESKIEFIRKCFLERLSLRGICRVFMVSFSTVYMLIEQAIDALFPFRNSVMPYKQGDIVELDELHSFVGNKKHGKRWVWVALNRRNRQVIAYIIGDRSKQTFKKLIRKIPISYLKATSYSDFWKAYKMLEITGNHKQVGKGSGQTNHVERFNCTLRQRMSRYVRKSLAFSKIDKFHNIMTKLFMVDYNLNHINT